MLSKYTLSVSFTELILSHNMADSVMTLVTPLRCRMVRDDIETEITVPLGFHTDQASIPKILGSFYPRHGRYTYPAVVHDYLYTGIVPRRQADKIFFELMIACNCRFYTCYIFWIMVRIFGHFRYKGTK